MIATGDALLLRKNEKAPNIEKGKWRPERFVRRRGPSGRKKTNPHQRGKEGHSRASRGAAAVPCVKSGIKHPQVSGRGNCGKKKKGILHRRKRKNSMWLGDEKGIRSQKRGYYLLEAYKRAKSDKIARGYQRGNL